MISTFTASTPAKRTLQDLAAQADIRFDGARPWDFQIHDERFYGRVLAGGSLGAGESYVDGWWDCADLEELFFRILVRDIDERIRVSVRAASAYVLASLVNLQSRRGAKKVAREHYDLGNDLFQAFLDPAMQYSCAYFNDTEDLATAQQRKMDLIARKLAVRPGDRVLDIGCGWGGLAKFLAERYGCSVTGVTIAERQVAFARELCRGLPVEILLCDYRDVRGTFDKVVSVGMLEHVGEKNYRTFMELVRSVLAPDGLFLLHTIGKSVRSEQGDPWVSRYIFPHSMIPSVSHIGDAAAGLFVMEDWHNMSADYAKTLRCWKANFDRNWDHIRERYGERFRRMWSYYLSCSAATFRARRSQLWQIVFSPRGVPGGYVPAR